MTARYLISAGNSSLTQTAFGLRIAIYGARQWLDGTRSNPTIARWHPAYPTPSFRTRTPLNDLTAPVFTRLISVSYLSSELLWI